MNSSADEPTFAFNVLSSPFQYSRRRTVRKAEPKSPSAGSRCLDTNDGSSAAIAWTTPRVAWYSPASQVAHSKI